ncbi:MAG: hypothetical protein IJV35_10905 [Neisseriaceae bacterium]|nr:hypothetical protein [Neisseriaceae bacterium]
MLNPFRRRQLAVSNFTAYGYVVTSRVKHGVAITTPCYEVATPAFGSLATAWL